MRWPLAAAAAGATLLVLAHSAAAAPPRAVSLDGGGWQLQRGGGAWSPVSVPSTFDPRPLAQLFGGRVGWYRLRFQPPPGAKGYAWALRFEQVRRRSVVWLNGRRLGSHDDPYTPFELEARGLRPGVNELVIRVDSRKGARPREGWWNWGGILRPVTLIPRGRLALSDLGLLPQVDCTPDGSCTAAIRLAGSLRNRTGYRQGGRIEVALTAPDGTRSVADFPVAPLPPAQGRPLVGLLPVQGTPLLWEPGSPQLYEAEVTVSSVRRIEQREHLRIGLRSISVADGHLMLNGRRQKLWGASIQEDIPGRGAALTPADNDEIVSELQALGADATRAHYPLSEDLLAKLDHAGILVWSQAPVYHQNAEFNRPAGRAAALATVRGAIVATRNHASVIVNSVANEPVSTPDAHPGSRVWLKAAATLARQLDPSRPVALDVLSYPNLPYQRTYRAFDLLGVNSYFGWYAGKPDRPTGNFLDLEPYLQNMRRLYPGQGLVMTEFGAEATHPGAAEEKGSFEFQADYVNRTMDVVARNDFMNGAIYWTLREFAVKPGWLGGLDLAQDPQPDSIHSKGLLAYGGTPKPAFSVMQERIRSVLEGTG
jgi:hypothetical protein